MTAPRRFLLTAAGTILAVAGCDVGRAHDDGATSRSSVAARQAPLVYGGDDRREIYELGADLEALARLARASLVALGDAHELGSTDARSDGDGDVSVLSPSAAARFGLCADEPFAAQPSFALCSGFAVADHLILTAAHCLEVIPPRDLVALSGFVEAQDGRLAPIAPAQLHPVTEVIATNPWRDIALVRLGGAPLVAAVLAPAPPADGDPVASVGHGMGVPAKAMPAGRAHDLGDGFFVTDLDAFGGASGAPVLDGRGEVIGVLTSGAADYEATATGCLTAQHRPEGSLAADELVEHAADALAELCELRFEPEVCAGQAGGGGCALGASPLRPHARAETFVSSAAFLVWAARRRGRRGRGFAKH